MLQCFQWFALSQYQCPYWFSKPRDRTVSALSWVERKAGRYLSTSTQPRKVNRTPPASPTLFFCNTRLLLPRLPGVTSALHFILVRKTSFGPWSLFSNPFCLASLLFQSPVVNKATLWPYLHHLSCNGNNGWENERSVVLPEGQPSHSQRLIPTT